MTDISDKTLGIIAGVALFVSLFGLFGLDTSNWLGFTGMGITGEARVNITEDATLNVTTTVIDFSNGTIESSVNNCTLSSDVVGDPLSCFNPSWSSQDGPQSGGFKIENVGNVQLNVTITSTKDADTFWGTTGGKYMYKCSGNGTIATGANAYVPFSGASQDCVWYLPVPPGTDGFTLDINITIPPTATGYKNDTITFNGVKATA